MNKEKLEKEIENLVRFIGINNPKTSGGWVDTPKVTKQIMGLFHQYLREEEKKIKREIGDNEDDRFFF